MAMRITVAFAITVVLCWHHIGIADGIIITDETRLHRDLFKSNRLVLPVADGQERKVNVTIGMTLNQVVDVVRLCLISAYLKLSDSDNWRNN